MKKLTCLILLILFVAPNLSQASNFGAGFILGNPTGLSFKNWLDREHALDFALAWDFTGEDSLSLHGDYLWHKYSVFKIDERPIDFYFGAGARLLINNNAKKNDDDFAIGPRAPAGLRYQFRDPKIEIFAEVALILDLIPSTDADIDIGVGARLFF